MFSFMENIQKYTIIILKIPIHFSNSLAWFKNNSWTSGNLFVIEYVLTKQDFKHIILQTFLELSFSYCDDHVIVPLVAYPEVSITGINELFGSSTKVLYLPLYRQPLVVYIEQLS